MGAYYLGDRVWSRNTYLIIKLNKTLLSQIDHKFLKSILKKAEKNYTLYRQDTSVYDYRILD